MGTDDRLFDTKVVSDGAAEIAAQPVGIVSARDIVGAVIDFARESGMVIPSRYRGQLAKGIGELHKEGIEPALIQAAGEYVIREGLDPSLLASCVVTVQAKPPGDAEDKRLLRAFLDDVGVNWPTGWRMRRGTHGVSYVRDPLGVDRPDYKTAQRPPTRVEVLAALKERDGASERDDSSVEGD